MSEYATDTSSHRSWLDRDTPATSVGDKADNPTDPNLAAYHHYTTPPPIPEDGEWGAHDSNGVISSPHSSSGSMLGSPRSRQSSQRRDSMDQMSAGVQSAGEGQPQGMSISERRQEKRKMKRFRLTHNQTRFLMSEFARQAHPDAAHRERLAREIPGLSPRQVQVWFQNR